MGRLAGGMVLPLPFHSPVSAFCHIVHVCYGCAALATAAWLAIRLGYTYIVYIVPEFAEQGCTATLYMHGWSHTWFNPRTPMLYSDEAGERDLQVAKRYAPVTTTREDASISENLKHELYEKFLRKKKKITTAKIGAPVHWNLVLEACMVAANAFWQTAFQRLLRHLMTCQEAGGCKLYMHPAANSVKCTFPSAETESDVVCVCGSCGSKCGIHQLVPLEVEAVQSWPTMALNAGPNSSPVPHGVKISRARSRVRVNLICGPSTDQCILTQVPLLWFLLWRRRTVLPHFKVQVM